ncbi:MAG: hypothetical protein ACRDZV_05805 [Acidimicrobiia bacterium]
MAGDRVVLLRSDDPLAFLADACSAAADAVSEPRPWRPSDLAMVELYAELVVAYARLVRPHVRGTRLAIVDHLVGRVAQARSGEITTSLVDIVDRLHGELASERAPV